MTEEELLAIEAEGYLDGPVPALVVAYRELRALAAELAAALTLEDCTDLDCDYEDCQAIRDTLAKAREAGL